MIACLFKKILLNLILVFIYLLWLSSSASAANYSFVAPSDYKVIKENVWGEWSGINSCKDMSTQVPGTPAEVEFPSSFNFGAQGTTTVADVCL